MPSKNTPIVRIKDIALKANVSTGTVDRVIHNRGRVAEDVKERVLSILKELNYEPNLMARMLGSKSNMFLPRCCLIMLTMLFGWHQSWVLKKQNAILNNMG